MQQAVEQGSEGLDLGAATRGQMPTKPFEVCTVQDLTDDAPGISQARR